MNKKIILSIIGTAAVMGTAAYAAPGDYIVILKEDPIISFMDADSRVINHAGNVYVVDSLMSAYALAPADNIEMIVPDEVAYLFEGDMTVSDMPVSIYGEEASLMAEKFPEGTDDTYYNSQWYLPYINVNGAWRNGFLGDGVRVGIIDSGMETTHPDLPVPVEVYNTLDQADSSNVYDELGHGTSVTGVVAAKTNNARDVSGIAFNSEIVSIKVASASSLATSDLMIGFKKAVEYGCDVINMSLGFTRQDSPGAYESMKSLVDSAVKDGIIVVASAGNAGDDPIKGAYYQYPASYENVVSVGSLGDYVNTADESADYIKVPSLTSANSYYKVYPDVPSSFTQFNDALTCAAPGYLIVTTDIGGKVNQKAGTSFASPVVAAAAAIAKNINPKLTAQEFMEALEKTCSDVYTEGYDIYTGYGALNIDELVKYISTELPPKETDEPTSTPEMTDEPTSTPEVTDEPDAIIRNGNSYTIKTSFEELPSDARVFAAIYSDGKLLGVKSTAVSAGSNTTKIYFTHEGDIDYAMIYVWEYTESGGLNLVPLTNRKYIEK